MKYLYLLFILLGFPLFAAEVTIFNQNIKLPADCATITVTPKGQYQLPRTIPLTFTYHTDCQMLPYSETNVPRLEFLAGTYVMLIESRHITETECRAELIGVVVKANGEIYTSGKPSVTTSTCGTAEQKDFEILYHKATKLFTSL